jgi:hypothetical protein
MKCVNTDEELKQIQMELKLHTEVLKSDREPIEKKLKATEAALKLVKKQKQKQLAAYQEFARTGKYPIGLLKDRDITDPQVTNRRIETLKAEIEHMDSQIEAFDYTRTIAEETNKQIAGAARLSELFKMLDSETYIEEESGVTGKKHGPESQALTKINDEIARLEKAQSEKFAEQIKLKKVKDEQIKVAVRIAELRGGIVESGGKEVTAPTREMATELQKLAELQQEEKTIRESMQRRTSYEEELVKEENQRLDSAKNKLAKLLSERDSLARGEKPEAKGKKADVAPRDRAMVEAEIKQVRQEIKDLKTPKKEAPTQAELDAKELQKQIDSLDVKILRMTQGTEKKPRGAKQMAVTEDLMPLVEERNAKAKKLADMQEAARPKKEAKPVKDVYQRALESRMRRRDELERRIKEGPKPAKGKLEGPYTEERAKLEEEIAQLMAEQKDTDWFKERNQESALRRWKASQLKKTAFMKKQIEENDFSKPVDQKRQIELDAEAERILAERKNVENEYRKAKEKAEYEAMTPAQRALYNINAFKRLSILSGPTGIAKLTSASFGVLQNRALTESVGYGFSKIPLVKEIMKKDPFSSTYEAQKLSRDMTLYVKGLVKGGKEFLDIWSGKGSELSKKFGEDSGVPPNWLGFFSRLHEAIKYPTLRANYDMGYARYRDWAERNGMNPESPEVINQAEIEAFKYANESIFKEDNWLVRKYQNLTEEARKSSSPMRRALGFGLEQTLPIVKIPSNLVKQTFEHIFGSLPATYKLIDAAVRGTENMTSEEAHILIRQMKRGSTGLLLMAMGVLLKDYIGGLYIKGEDEQEDMPYGTIKAGGLTIPKYLMENPLFACLQVGATAARFWENHYGEDEGFLGNVKLAARTAALTSIGVVEEAPFVSAILNADKALRGAQNLDTTLSEIYARPYIPAALQFVADIQDLDDGIDLKNKPLMENFSTLMNRRSTRRTPSDWFEAIELGIPFLRQEVSPR